MFNLETGPYSTYKAKGPWLEDHYREGNKKNVWNILEDKSDRYDYPTKETMFSEK
jgi:hypothetical protein